ncbi:glycosyltransferase family 87 protein [Sneathiella sp. HT1-7]|uniref:glycosyltransferase family 87 protein n=1 Tax=Sneathiella sp. HT1-7 TaxID=2887192 RepID=UPI001D13AAA5|nr:glycosyltransferase family 87 protein [Sneathiella sp. HT1-7]MCC3304212.1 DUF2029 domain-containing protein [Sneathiella sp. HT1-7]
MLTLGVLISLFVINGLLDYFWGYGNTYAELRAVLLQAMEQDDSWLPMYEAAYARREFPDKGIYEVVFFENGIKFQYPPISLLPYIGLIKFGFDLPAIIKISYAVSFVAMLAIAFCGYKIAVVLLDKYGCKGLLSTRGRLGIFILSLLAIFTFHPIYIAQYLGQVQVIIDLLVCLAFLAWLSERKHLSGIMIATAALIKPTLILVFLWAMIRKEKACFVGMVVVFIPAGILSLAVFGFEEHLDYLRVLSYIGTHGEAFWPNQSMNGLLNRLLGGDNPGSFDANSYSGYNLYVYAGTMISTVCFILFGLFYNRPKSSNNVASALDLATMVLLSVMATPTAWTHHYGVLWPILVMAIMVSILLMLKGKNQYAVTGFTLLCIGYFFISNYFSFTDNPAYYAPPVNLILSHFLYGGFITLFALLLLRRAASGGLAGDVSRS